MKFLIKVMDTIVMQVVWLCYVIYNTWIHKEDKTTGQVTAASQFQDATNNDRHFIHLYTTNQYGQRPICYMDVYKMNSPSDEQKLRDVASKGLPNKTYMKYQQLRKAQCPPGDWLEYSTIAL